MSNKPLILLDGPFNQVYAHFPKIMMLKHCDTKFVCPFPCIRFKKELKWILILQLERDIIPNECVIQLGQFCAIYRPRAALICSLVKLQYWHMRSQLTFGHAHSSLDGLAINRLGR